MKQKTISERYSPQASIDNSQSRDAIMGVLNSSTVLNGYRVKNDFQANKCKCYLWLRDACNWMNPSGSGCD